MESTFRERVNVVYDKLTQLLDEARQLSSKLTANNNEERLSWYDMCCRRKRT